MFALVTQFNVEDGSPLEGVTELLQQRAVPRAKEMGAVEGYWLSAHDGHTLSVVLFDSEEAARAAVHVFKVGEAAPLAPGVTWRSEEIREVLAQM